MSGIDKSSEYNFYYSCLHNYALVAKMNAYDKALFQALKDKVHHYGVEGLNKNGFGANSVILNKSEQPEQAIGKRIDNPLIFATKEDAVSQIPEIYKNQLVTNPTVKDLQPVKGKTGYYFWNTSQGPAYIFTYKPPKAAPNTPGHIPPVSKPLKRLKAGVKTTYSGAHKPIKTPKPVTKEVPSQYDLLFNSLNYMSVGEAEIERLSMDLIFAGDDLLTDFDYQSIDYLPDFEIETINKHGDFVEVSKVYSNPTEPKIDSKPTDHPTVTTEALANLKGIMDKLFAEMKGNLEGKSYAQIAKYFGVITKNDGFNTGYSKGEKIDFKYPVSDSFNDYEIKIDFNLI